jgi:hypothetical protein
MVVIHLRRRCEKDFEARTKTRRGLALPQAIPITSQMEDGQSGFAASARSSWLRVFV